MSFSGYQRFYLTILASFTFFGFTKALPVYDGKGVNGINKDSIVEVGSTYSHIPGQNKLGDLLWENQEDLSDDILDALGEYEIQAKIIDHDFKLDGKDSSASIGPELKSRRLIKVVDQGEIDNGTPSKDYKTQYMVLDGISLASRLKVKTHLDDHTSLDLFTNYSGVRIEKISYTNSLDSYTQKKTIQNLAAFANLDQVNAQLVSEQGQANTEAPELAQQVYNDEGNGPVRKISDAFTDSEKTKIFFEGFFDPYKVFTKFALLDVEKLKDDNILKPGETLIKTYFRKFGPGIGAGKGVVGASIYHFTYRYLRIGFKKIAPGQILVKTQMDEATNNELNFSIGLPLISFKPERMSSTTSNFETNERLYQYDLNNAQAAAQLSSIVDLGNISSLKNLEPTGLVSKIPNEYDKIVSLSKEIPGAVDLLMKRSRNSLAPMKKVSNRTEFGIISLRTDRNKDVENRTTTSEDGSTDEVIGTIQSRYAKRIRLFNFFQSNENRNKVFRLISRPNANGDTVTDIGFEYTFENSKTSQDNYADYLNYVKSTLINKVTENSHEVQKLAKIVEDRLASKEDGNDFQHVFAGLYFSQGFVRKIVSHNVADLQTLMAQFILKDNPTWQNLVSLQKNNGGALDCRHVLTQDAKDMIFGHRDVACSRISAVAQNIVNTLTIAQKVGVTNAQVATAFTRLVENRELRPIVPRLMLAVGLLKSFDKGLPQFESLDEAIANHDVEINLNLVGKGIDGVQKNKVGSVENITPYQYSKDFNVVAEESRDSDPIITNASVYADKSKTSLYVDFFSILRAQPGYKVKGVVYKYKALRADEPLAYVQAKDLVAVEKREKGSGDLLGFNHTIALPWIKEITPDEDHTLQFWFEDVDGTRMSQVFEVKFKL